MMEILTKSFSFKKPDNDAILFFKGIIWTNVGLIAFIIISGFLFNDFMNSFIGNLWYPVSASIVSFAFIILLIYRTETQNIVQIRFLLITFISVFLFTLIQIFRWDIAVRYTPFHRQLDHPVLNLADLFIVVCIIALYYHFESIRDGDPNFYMIIIISLFAVPYFILSYLVMVYNNSAASQLLYDMLPFFAITVLMITIYGMNTMIRIYFISSSHLNKMNSLLTISGLYLMVFSFISQVLTADSMSFGFFRAEIYQLAILTLSLLIIAGVYLRSPQFLYFTTSQIHQFYLLNSDEIVLWNYQPWPPKYLQDELDTMSRILMTSSSLLSEVTDKSDTVREIKFSKTGTIIIEKLGIYSLIFVIENHSRYLDSAIMRYKQRINSILAGKEIDLDLVKNQFYRTFQVN